MFEEAVAGDFGGEAAWAGEGLEKPEDRVSGVSKHIRDVRWKERH